MVHSTGKPYQEIKNKNIIQRIFPNTVDEFDLIWHRDKKNRILTVLEGIDWFIQMENMLPQKMEKDKTFYIKAECFHRLIKGKNDLKIEIIEIDNI